MNKLELKEFLNFKVEQYNTPEFIETDPVQIPHQFTKKEDKEISGFLTATISWGNRKSILKNATTLMDLLGNSPYDFVMEHSEKDLDDLKHFVHRTFNGTDLTYFVKALRNIYTHHQGMEAIFSKHSSGCGLQVAIHEFKKIFFELPHEVRTEKHVSDPLRNSAAKRINMFLRWMVRDDPGKVDLGIWKDITPADLSCPLDVHSGKVARQLGLLKRKQNDAKAVSELDSSLKQLDPLDPVKYDFALFGLGVFEKY